MRKFYRCFSMFAFLLCFLSGVALGADGRKTAGKTDGDPTDKTTDTDPPKSETRKSYVISSGDLLNITVFGEPDLSLDEVRVASNGSISFPLLGEITIKGLSTAMLEKHLVNRLRDGYLKKPKVIVSILEYRMFYVNGEVHKPGGYKYVDGLNVQKAIALAGGFTERASKSKITLIREDFPDEPLHSVELNIEVRPGDILTIGESYF